MNVLSIALDVPLYQTFSYIHSAKLAVGQRVLIEFNHKKMVGFVWEEDVSHIKDKQKLKPILEVYPEIIPKDIIDLIKFCSNYYHYPIGATIFNVIPKLLKQTKPCTTKTSEFKLDKAIYQKQIELNNDQMAIFNEIKCHLSEFYPAVIYGITGSGKTELYLKLIEEVVNQGSQVLVLVPEINLTPQMLERFKNKFSDKNIAILTSQVTPLKRYQGYCAARDGIADIIIGTRLSTFTSFKQLGLIIVDEEHDQSFKQNDSLRYQARDLAIWRASQLHIPVILGSATPSLETLYNYKLGRYKLYKLKKRAVDSATLPKIELIDLNQYPVKHGLTETVIDALKQRLKLQELSMVFINRRGYSPVFSCYDCGWVSTCKQCSTTMVYHKVNSSLKCHHCSFTVKIPHTCPKCNSQHLQVLGDGTQKIEAVLEEYLPEARIYRIDQDSISSKNAWYELYDKIHNHEIDILVGTQMLAKGHDFHNLTLVVGLNIDSGLYSYDFRASELLFTQLTQVAGRSGRGQKPGTVMLQTKYPDHDLYQYLIRHDFPGFINYLLVQRKTLSLPPYTYYAIFRASGKKIEQVMEYLFSVVKLMEKINIPEVIVYPAVPSVMQRLKNKERGQILVQSNNRNRLHQLFDQLIPLLQQMKPKYAITFSLDIDPYEI